MRCCVSVNDCSTSTTNSLKARGTDHETTMDADCDVCAARDCRLRGVRLRRRRGGDVALELADAADRRLARDHLLAGARPAHAVPDPLRRIRRLTSRATPEPLQR